MQVSIFEMVDRTSTPIKSLPLVEALNVIKDSPQKELIELARLKGKESKDFEKGTYFVDFDLYQHTLRNQDVLSKLKNSINKNENIKFSFFTSKFEPDFIEKQLSNLGISFYQIHKVDKLINLINLQNESYAFICPTWHSFDKIRQEKENKKGEYSLDVRNLYDFIKCTKVPIVTWNCEFEGKRNIKNAKNLSGFLYMEIDDFMSKSKEEVYSILTDNGLSFIKAVWKSFGGKGYGFLIAVDGLTLDNFKYSWINIQNKFFSEFGIKVDKATKDISRINVLSSDENIFIRENINPLEATNEIKNAVIIKVSPMSETIQTELLGQQLNNFYNDKKYFHQDEGRLTYAFYQNFLSKTNHLGILLDDIFAFISNNQLDYPLFFSNPKYSYASIQEIGERQYTTYADQFGTIQFDKNQYNISDDYVILGIYEEYRGDGDMKLQQLWKRCLEKETTEQSIVVKLALVAKRIGIPFAKIVSFVEQKYSYNPENILKIKSIYGNTKYPFGILTSLKDSVVEKRKLDYIARQKDNGYELVENSLDEKEIKSLLKDVLLKIGRRIGKITDRNVDAFLQEYFKETNSYAILLKDALNFVKTSSEYYAIERHANFWGKEVYEYSRPYFGLRFQKIVTEKEFKKKVTIAQTIKLPNNQKLSDINLKVKDNKILWADTNMGKTTWACTHENEKRIILVPTIGALKSIESKYGAAVFYETKKDISPNDEIIACTYSSFPNMFNILKSWGKIKEYTLYFDEQHNLAVSSEKMYRNRELNFVLDNMDAFGKRVFMTGTYFPVQHPNIKSLEIQRIKWQTQPIKNAQVVYYEDKIKSIEKLLVRGKKNIIYLQNKKMHKTLGKLTQYLKEKGWSGIYLLNANEKNEPHFKNLITNEYFENDAQIIITTSVAVEAINILDLDVETIHFMTFDNPRIMEQMVNRTRIKLPSNIYIYKKKVEHIEESNFVDIVKMQQNLIIQAENMVKYLSIPKQKLKDSYDMVSAQKLFANQIFEKSSLFRVKDGQWEVDYLSIAYKVFQEETRFAKNNLKYLELVLSEYGWKFSEPMFDVEKISKEEKETFEIIKQKIVAEIEFYAIGVLESVKKEGLSSLKKQVNEDKSQFNNFKYPDVEWSIRIKILKSSKYMDFEESCRMMKDWITIHKMSDTIFDKIMRQIAVQIARLSGAMESTINFNDSFSQNIIKFYLEQKEKYPDKLYSKDELIDVFNKRKRTHNVLKEIDGNKYAIDVFRKYFEVNSVLQKDEIFFKLGGLNPINEISIFSKRFYEWADLTYNTGLLFTSEELATIINELRKNLPMLEMHKVDSAKSLKVITDYVTLEKTTKRIGGVPKVHYRIFSLSANLIKDYKIKINQKVTISKKDTINYEILKNFYEKNNGKNKHNAVQISSSGSKSLS